MTDQRDINQSLANGVQITDINENATGLRNHVEQLKLSEKDKLTNVKRRVSAQTAGQLRLTTLILSWFSVIILSILGIITFVVAIIDKSSASFAFALDAGLDVLSSCVVIWRFYTAESLYNNKKEKKACIVLGVLFLVSFVSVCVQSSARLISGKPPRKADLVWYLAIVNAIACLVLFLSKAYLARQLESTSLATDAVNSAIGFLLAVAAFAGDIIHEEHPHIWYLDPVLGILCSVFLLVYGIWIIVYEVRINKHVDDYTNMEE